MNSITKVIRVVERTSDDEAAALEGHYLYDSPYYQVIAGEPTDVLKPDGSPLLIFRPGAISRESCDRAMPALRKAAGQPNDHRWYIASHAMGYYDKPTCRATAFTAKEFQAYGECLPFIRECSAGFCKYLRPRFMAQRGAVAKTNQDFVIRGTAFTTVTVNRWTPNLPAHTPVHKDEGDLLEGFGVIAVVGSGEYSGGYLVFPQYFVAVDLRTTDLVLADVHEWHGNVPIFGDGDWERLSAICYYRTAMQDCPR